MRIKVIITGHTRGLGSALAKALFDRHIHVLGLARHSHPDFSEHYSGLLTEFAIDLTDSYRLQSWLSGEFLKAWVREAQMVVLINNAGTLQPIGPLGAQTSSSIAAAVALNVSASLMLANAVVAASGTAKERRVLHISSGAARNAYSGWSVYCATKAALDRHAQSVALENTKRLRICSLAPGVVDTAMQAEIRATSKDVFPMQERFVALRDSGSLWSPEDCAERLVEYLLGPDFGQEAVADLRDLGK